jgi:topoisomerase-4 subunit A
MATKHNNNEEHIENQDFVDALGERYLAYALSTIMSRSLPDVRDGLKPVHRRLLYAMLQLKLDPKSGFKKCARVVGDVMGKYHPHGDAAIYDTLVRLAQDFSVRYPLIDGQGNFGSIDGDNAAAMRYTESRLTETALYLLKDIDKETVSFRPTYDAQDAEPLVLPASFPNLLANGSEGIAVGMATSIPPHNVAEICDALLHLIKKPNATIEDLIEFIPAPDFPTGGILVEPKSNILNAYTTGRGSLRLRAKWHKEILKSGLYQVIITEIPYQVQKAKLVEKIAELYRDKKLVLLGNIFDESAEEIRIVLEPKSRLVDPDILMESLFKLTDLEVRVNMNLNVLTKDTIPKVMNLKELLIAFLEHRFEVVTKRTEYSLVQINNRLEVLEGLLIAYLNLDEIIRIIREEDEAKQIMMKRFKLTEPQVEAILNMRLRSLRKLEEVEIRKEHEKLSKEKKELEAILADDKKCWQVIGSEIKEIQKVYNKDTLIGKRRTEHVEKLDIPEVISIEAFIEKEPVTVICSKMGWIRAVSSHSDDAADVKYKEGDEQRFIVKAYTTDKIIAFTKLGKSYAIPCDKLPRGKGHGNAIRLMIDMDTNDDIIELFAYKGDRKFLLASKSGRGFIIDEPELFAKTSNGKQVMSLKDKDEAIFCREASGDAIALIGANRKMLVCKMEEIPEMKRGQGVTLQKYKQAYLVDAKIFKLEEGLTWELGDRTRTEANIMPWLGKRGAVGKMPPVGFPKNNKFA